MRKYAVLSTQMDDSDSDSIKEEMVTSESSNSDLSSGEGGSGSGTSDQGDDELISEDEGDRRRSSQNSRRKTK